MIVVGFLGAPGRDGELALEVARRAGATGARVEMVGIAAPDAAGDARLLELAAAGIGHATVVRSGADRLEAADLDLALHYLPEIRAIVLVDPEPALIGPATAESGWSGASLVVVSSRAAELDTSAAPQAIVIEPPPNDRDGVFAGLLAALAARLEAGEDPAAAWRATAAALAVDPVSRS
ncbi:MAG TPA: hypothetical protein VL749_02870 [Patescibacteria group bacterium]|nr:hypothetical protein [Patescibacteria group bacterium]